MYVDTNTPTALMIILLNFFQEVKHNKCVGVLPIGMTDTVNLIHKIF